MAQGIGEDDVIEWRRMVALGAQVRDPEYLSVANDLAAKIMRAARACLEQIVERLGRSGYRFAVPELALRGPAPDAAEAVRELESLVGVLPLGLRAAIEHLGAVNLTGEHPGWPRSAHLEMRPVEDEDESQMWFTDPLVLVPIEQMLAQAYDTEGGRYQLAFSGDPYTKAGFSGGIYAVILPCAAADSVIDGDANGRTFVEYMRLPLAYGGFAGFAGIGDRPAAFLRSLIEGCAPL